MSVTVLPSHTRRVVDREPCSIQAKVLAGFDKIEHCCTIRDISERGARLALNGAQLLPRRFLLALSAEADGECTLCEVRWRVGDVVGVRFLSDPLEAKISV